MSLRRHVFLIIFVLVLVFLEACTQLAASSLPLPDQTEGEWVELQGAAGTVCVNGSDYKYYSYKGSSNKLVIDFQGGGACWDDASCSLPIYLSNANASLTEGIYDHNNARNPFKDWYHTFIPYCTADLHIGNNTKTYTNPANRTAFTLQHKGAINARSVLDWTFKNFPDPEVIVITGCSAGAYGAAYWTDFIKSNYTDTDVYQLGDCGVGAATDAFGTVAQANWNPSDVFPDQTIDADFTNQVYIDTINKYSSGLKMAQYNTLFDQTQIQFYGLITGQTDPALAAQVAAEWSGILTTSLAQISAGAPGFRSYTSQGSQHCIITSNDLYTREENGSKLVAWISDYISGSDLTNIAPAQ